MIVVYADESGTHGVRDGKEPAPTICGFLATPEMWEKFRLDWTSGLKRHGAPHFHFRELNPDFQKKNPDNHFSTWDKYRKDDFIHDMAIVASSGPVPFGGNDSVKREYGDNPTKEQLNERYRTAFEVFFDDFGNQIDRHFPDERGKVSFFFDDNQSSEWVSILDCVIKEKRKSDSRIGEYTPVEDTSERGMPCQAADLLAYVNRQNNETVYDLDLYVPQRILDIIVSRQGYPEWHPFRALKEISDEQWKNLIAELRGRKKQFDLQHELSGTKPKPQYYPILYHPYFQYLYRLCSEHKKRHPELWV